MFKVFARANAKGYSDEAFGFVGVMAGGGNAWFAGRLGDPEEFLLHRLRRTDLWLWLKDPGTRTPSYWDEDVLFDVLEVWHNEVVSLPLGRNDSGDYRFDRAAAQANVRMDVNTVLALHTPPMELLESGEVVERPPEDLATLVDEPLPEGLEHQVTEPIRHAVVHFRRRGATVADKRAAVKELVDALEYMRQDLENTFASKDANAIFELANRFHIRHNDRSQKVDYNKEAWLDWTFYVYLATARTMGVLREEADRFEREPPSEPDNIPF